MMACWQLVPSDRPAISAVCASLDNLLSADMDYLDLLGMETCGAALNDASEATSVRAEANGYVDMGNKCDNMQPQFSANRAAHPLSQQHRVETTCLLNHHDGGAGVTQGGIAKT